MIADWSSAEGRRHRFLLSSASEIRITKREATGEYEVVDIHEPARVLIMDMAEVARLRLRADKAEVAITSRMRQGDALQEATRLHGRLESGRTFRPSLHRFEVVDGQQRTLEVRYHRDGRAVPAAVISGGAAAFLEYGVVDSQALREKDADTGVADLGRDERPLFCRSTYSGADEVHIDMLPANNVHRRAGQPYRVSVGMGGGEKVFVAFASEADIAALRPHLDRTFLVIREEGREPTQKGWAVPEAIVDNHAS